MEIPGFLGDLLEADDERFERARQIWNGEIQRRPALIARCAGTADVLAAVRLARERDLPIAIRGGAHAVAGHAMCDDGLVIEIAGTVADKAAKTDRGAEATNGQIVIASVRIENNTKKPYDAKGVLIGAKYGDDNDAQIIIDKTNELQSGFKGKIKPKDEDVATVGFAVPWKELNKVTFIVDANDDVHEVISFTGRVHRA